MVGPGHPEFCVELRRLLELWGLSRFRRKPSRPMGGARRIATSQQQYGMARHFRQMDRSGARRLDWASRTGEGQRGGTLAPSAVGWVKGLVLKSCRHQLTPVNSILTDQTSCSGQRFMISKILLRILYEVCRYVLGTKASVITEAPTQVPTRLPIRT